MKSSIGPIAMAAVIASCGATDSTDSTDLTDSADSVEFQGDELDDVDFQAQLSDDCVLHTNRPDLPLHIWYDMADDELSEIERNCSATQYQDALEQHYDDLIEAQRDRSALIRELPELRAQRDNRIGDIRAVISGPASEALTAAAARSAELRELEKRSNRLVEHIAELALRIQEVVTRFEAFSPSAEAAVERLKSRVAAASSSAVADLQSMLIETINDSRETRHPWTLLRHDAENLRHELEYVLIEFSFLAQSYADFDPTASALDAAAINRQIEVLAKIVGVLRQGDAQYSKRVEEVLSGLQRRIDALVQEHADDATREAAAQAAFLHKSTVFLDEINDFLNSNSAGAEQTPNLGITLLSARYQQSVNIITYAELCDPPAQVWMTTGCNALQLRLGPAETYIASTAPFGIQFASIIFPSYGADVESLQTMNTLLSSGDLAGALIAHDRLALSLDAAYDGATP